MRTTSRFSRKRLSRLGRRHAVQQWRGGKSRRFEVDTDAGGLTSSRPGGVLWPKVAGPYLRIVLGYTTAYTAPHAKETMKGKLKISWSPTDADTSHAV